MSFKVDTGEGSFWALKCAYESINQLFLYAQEENNSVTVDIFPFRDAKKR